VYRLGGHLIAGEDSQTRVAIALPTANTRSERWEHHSLDVTQERDERKQRAHERGNPHEHGGRAADSSSTKRSADDAGGPSGARKTADGPGDRFFGSRDQISNRRSHDRRTHDRRRNPGASGRQQPSEEQAPADAESERKPDPVDGAHVASLDPHILLPVR
jgi:hypothetical protein